jgi:hypothetical protein
MRDWLGPPEPSYEELEDEEENLIFCERCNQIIEPRSRIADYGANVLCHLECARPGEDFKVRTLE